MEYLTAWATGPALIQLFMVSFHKLNVTLQCTTAVCKWVSG